MATPHPAEPTRTSESPAGGKRHRVFRNFGISTQIYLWGLFILLLAFAISAGTSWYIADQRAHARIQSTIDNDLTGFTSEYDQETHDLETLGNWLVKQQTFIDLVRAGDHPGLTAYLQPWTQASIVDALTVTDAHGVVLTRVRMDHAPSQGDDVSAAAGISEALNKGQVTHGMEMDVYGRPQGRFILPISSPADSSRVGALVLGFFLDGDFLKHLSGEGSSDVVIAYQDRIVASSLVDAQNKPWVGWLVPADVVLAERASQATSFATLQTPRGEYLFKFKPLQSPASQTVGMVGIGLSLDVIRQERVALWTSFGIGLLVALVVLVVAAFQFSRRLLVPIATLERATESMAAGDLTTSIDLKRRDELGALAGRLDHMRQELSRAMGKAVLEKSRSDAIIRSMGIAALVTDENLCIVACNPAAEQALQQSEANLTHSAWQEIFSPVNQPGSSAGDREQPLLQPGAQQVLRRRYRLRTQPRILLEIVSSPVVVAGSSAGYVHIIQDVSALEQMLRSKDEFVMNVAHELRGPTGSLRSFIELLKGDLTTMTPRDARLLIDALERAILKFQKMVENLIDIGSIQAGQFRVQPIPNELDDIIKQATAEVEPVLKANGQSLQLVMEARERMVLADEFRIVQVLVNLLGNASKYSPEGDSLTLATRREGEFIRFEITDHGQGISPEAQLHIFERFYRVRRAREEAMGIGLGLALSKAIVEAHGGQIGVDSQVGHGSTFWFTIPEVK